MTRRCLVVSAVNFTEGGPLTVLRSFVEAACDVLPPDWDIVVFLHDRRLISHSRPRLIEIPESKRSWRTRLLVEYRRFARHARSLKPDLWVSLHDISPNVGSVPQVVYCHNPLAFHRLRWREAVFQPTLLVFWLAYSWLYRINLRRNRAVIVQQDWLRNEFRKWAGPDTEIIVAHPVTPAPAARAGGRSRQAGQPVRFLYPTLPRAFKNIELLCEACALLEPVPDWRSEIQITISGAENAYSRWLSRKFGGLRGLRFIGRQTPAQMQERYGESDCLLFPSRLETWGLPISEAKEHGLPMLVADLPYARETVGNYEQVEFIDIDDARALSDKLLAFQQNRLTFTPVTFPQPAAPFVSGWHELLSQLLRLVNTRSQSGKRV